MTDITRDDLRKELIQVAAVAVAWVGDVNRLRRIAWLSMSVDGSDDEHD